MACASKPSPQRPQRLQVLVLLLSLALCSPAHGFWFTSARAKSQAPQWFGIRDYPGAAQAAYSYDSTGGVAVAVPVAVPLSPHQLQVSPPYPGLNSVQLVPCLCPISKDPDSIKPMSSMATGPMHQVSSMSSMHVVQPSSVQQNAQPSQQHAHMQQQQ